MTLECLVQIGLQTKDFLPVEKFMPIVYSISPPLYRRFIGGFCVFLLQPFSLNKLFDLKTQLKLKLIQINQVLKLIKQTTDKASVVSLEECG